MTKGQGGIPDGKGTFIFNVYMYLSLSINCEILQRGRGRGIKLLKKVRDGVLEDS